MTNHTLRTSLVLPRPLDEVFPFFAAAENLGRVTPAEMDFRIRTPLPITMEPGRMIDYTIRLHGVPMRWRTLISEWNPPHGFVDEQVAGPYALWHHRHRFTAVGPAETLIEDEVTYRLPLAPLGDLVHPIVRRQLTRIFTFRQDTVRTLLAPDAPATPVQVTID